MRLFHGGFCDCQAQARCVFVYFLGTEADVFCVPVRWLTLALPLLLRARRHPEYVTRNVENNKRAAGGCPHFSPAAAADGAALLSRS